jgi:hypothetical protein
MLVAMKPLQQGEQLALALLDVMSRMRTTTVDADDWNACNDCSASDISADEFQGRLCASSTYRFLESFVKALQSDPSVRSHVVDQFDSPYTEDSIWLSMSKLCPQMSWSVCTIRTMERTSFRQIFDKQDGWTADLMNAGSGHVRKESVQAFYSDQPRLVSRYGRQLAKVDADMPVVRVFRCAPRPALKRGIESVLSESRDNNVYDIWIRHFDMTSGDHVGTFQHKLNADISLLEMLTDVEMIKNIPRCAGRRSPRSVADIDDVHMDDGEKVIATPTEAEAEPGNDWLQLLEPEPQPESPSVSPTTTASLWPATIENFPTSPNFVESERSHCIGEQSITTRQAYKLSICTDVRELADFIHASCERSPATEASVVSGEPIQYDDSVLNPMRTTLDAYQKHLNKLNHLSPIQESPSLLNEKTGCLTRPDTCPCLVGKTPAPSPADGHVVDPWKSPLHVSSSSTHQSGISIDLLLSELAAVVGGGTDTGRGIAKESLGSPAEPLQITAELTKLRLVKPESNEENLANSQLIQQGQQRRQFFV